MYIRVETTNIILEGKCKTYKRSSFKEVAYLHRSFPNFELEVVSTELFNIFANIEAIILLIVFDIPNGV